jgi:hypothetical protein
MIEALVIGFHLGSVHVPAKDDQNNRNTGAYVCMEEWCAGGYRNTIDRDTFYVTHELAKAHGFSLHAGLVTGYQKKCQRAIFESGKTTKVEHRPDGSIRKLTYTETEERDVCEGHTRGAVAPILTLSYKPPFQVFGLQPRIFYVPAIEKKGSHVIHFSVEF